MIALDTLGISKRLKEAGFSETQAEAVTGVLRDTREFDLSQLATKVDLAGVKAELSAVRNEIAVLRNELRAEIAAMRTELEMRIDAKIEAAKSEMIKWVVGVGFAQVATILAVLRLFPGGHP